MTIKPITNYGLIAKLAIERGCVSLGELLIDLALMHIRPSAADVEVMRRVFVEYQERRPIETIRNDN